MGSLTPPTLFAQKHYVENYSKTAAFVLGTYYTALGATVIGEIMHIRFSQQNTPTNGIDMSFRITIDGEVYTGVAFFIGHNQPTFLYITIGGAVGAQNTIEISTEQIGFGVREAELAAGVDSYISAKRWGGHEVLIEYQIDAAIEVGQRVDIDITYSRKEAV